MTGSGENKPHVFKGIICGVGITVLVHLAQAAIAIILALILGGLATVPLIGSLLEKLFIFRRDSPTWFIVFVSFTVVYAMTTALIDKIKNRSTAGVAALCVVILMFICGIVTIITQVIAHDAFYGGIADIVFAVMLFRHHM